MTLESSMSRHPSGSKYGRHHYDPETSAFVLRKRLEAAAADPFASTGHRYDPETDELTDREQQVRDEIMDRVWAQVPVDSSNVTVAVHPPNFFDALFGTDPRAELAKIGVRG